MFSVIVIQDENKYEYMFCNEDLYVPEFLFIYITVFIYIGYVKVYRDQAYNLLYAVFA